MEVKRRLLMTVAATGALLLALVAASFVAAAMIRRDLGRISEEHARFDEQYALRRLLRGSASAMAVTKTRIGSLGQVAIQEGGELQFIRALEQAAAASGVAQEILLETVNQKDLSAWEKEIPLTLRVTGTYPKVLRHLNAIERLPFAISVDRIDVAAQTINDPNGAVRATVNAKVYWLAAASPDFVRGPDDGQTSPARP